MIPFSGFQPLFISKSYALFTFTCHTVYTSGKALMILKKLEIQGFKSFADRTEILFTPGVTAVVGPNGSGKSNISDAILWALGEQNIRNIRGHRSQDVIFAGTSKRKPVSMAEVSLTFDNASGKLPLDYNEVTVTRRAFRSGESEFFINKTPCRLKDIYELFMDTGVGREAYSIVSQGELDAVLSAKSEDRRALFDEAAGIKKFRHRKKEAERKLENTDQNLNRVNDIIYELHGQIEPMAEQAETAKRYLELSERLQDIEVGILVSDLQRYNAEIQNLRNDKDIDVEELEKIEKTIFELKSENEELADAVAKIDMNIESSQSAYQESLSNIEKTLSQLNMAKQQIANTASMESSLMQEIAQLSERVSDLETQQNELNAETREIQETENKITSELQGKSLELQKLQDNINLKLNAANSQKMDYIELAKQLAAQRNELANITQRIESLSLLLNKRNEEISKSENLISSAKEELRIVESTIAQLKTDQDETDGLITASTENLKKEQANIRNTSDEISNNRSKTVGKQSRLKTLREMEDSKEGYYQGVRSIASAVKSKSLKGEYAVVADVIKVPKGYEMAFETALGSNLQDIITDTDQEAKYAIEYLKRSRSGRATFLPLNSMRNTTSPMLKESVGKNGIIGIGSELISFDNKYAPAINSLLSKTLIAKDIDSALAASKTVMGWNKIVTLEGELISPSGAITGGHISGKTANILGRKQEISALSTEISILNESIEKAAKSLKEHESALNEITNSISALEEKKSKIGIKLLEKERQKEFTNKELKRYCSELESLQFEKNDIENNIAEAKKHADELSNSVNSSDKQNVDLDDLMSQTEKEIKELQDELDTANNDINTLKVEIAALTQKRSGLKQILENSAHTLNETKKEIERKQTQLKDSGVNKIDTESQILVLEDQLTSQKALHETAKIDLDNIRNKKAQLSESNQSISEQLKNNSQAREALSQKLHSAELRETRLDVQISQAIVRLLDEYDITAEDALNRTLPAERDGSTAEVVRLRREIKSMGEVNTGAVQEYARITERYEFLDKQRLDLTDAREKLIDAIKEIDAGTRGIFMETFNAVDEAFRVMFIRLFNGGDTQLILTDPDNLQDTGIDVMVEMPGKKRQNLLLLSGGERALTAAALMFALMTVRPSPFCVLDEIDAPLDDANVEKFADVIREFAERSQMIVITHNRATMEAADILYGVTMQEPGISKLVSVQIAEAAS